MMKDSEPVDIHHVFLLDKVLQEHEKEIIHIIFKISSFKTQ